ncbi:hypothetical protein C1645_819480 [Glomus cerebriforme]|uniref:Crinkler effector protein N-terminal domain-containing protein n=1 Tax=Glomus cerebriforme TaxID=658196 RepID=A0A397T5E7_9GLOM|nr:hypothetical protein C1645_819480 [Glomus cerebriforme]
MSSSSEKIARRLKISDEIIVDNCTTQYEDITVSDVKSLILSKKGINYSPDNLNLWKVDHVSVDKNDELLETFSIENDIKEKLGGELMQPRLPLDEYFNENSFKDKESKSAIHIIVQLLTTTTAGPFQQGVPQGPVARSLQEALSIILQNIPDKIKTSNETTKIPDIMPLKDRDTNKALEIFNYNVTKSSDPSAAKSKFNFLVCSGAAGIGKTRWGKEFFDSVKRHWKPPSGWEKPEYLYILLDFVNGVRLCELDANLTASIILGLRLAYDYFARRVMSFEAFQHQARLFFDNFKINLVLSHILSQRIEPNQKLIVILHIDEYQEIFAFEGNWKGGLSGKGLFKEMLYALGPLMIECKSEYYVQTFLSGTATRDVTKNFKPTEYSFTFVQCPLLSTKSIVEIFDFFAKKEDREGHWMCNTRVLQLLYDTSGLPRALETVIDECFKRETFFLEVKKNNFTLFDDVFQAVINSLTNQYKLDKFIANNHDVSYKLLYYSIGAIPVQFDTVISSEPTVLMVEDLERDGFLILKRIGTSYLAEMPFYFIYIYNTWLNIVPNTIHKMLQPDSKMIWNTWEKFVANYEVFRNNLFVKLKKYKEGISLKEFYREAVGKDSVLEIIMGLKKLDLREAKNQFPKTGLPINRLNNKVMDLDGFVILNGHSAPFADIFLLRKTIPESKNLLIAFQQKWYTTSQKFTIDDAVTECNKNNNAYKNVKNYDLRKFLKESRIVTIIFTLRPFKGNPNDLPDDCLIIAKKNFNQYFGPLFVSRLSFDIVNHLNINSAEPKQIAERIDGIGEVISEAIHKNQPYKNASELIEKNKTYKTILEKVRTQLEDCSFTPQSFFLDSDNHDLMMVDEYDSYSNNDTDMEIV